MTRRIDTIYENGVFRPVEMLSGIAENSIVTVTVDIPERKDNTIKVCVGILPDEDAAEMSAIIADEFERIDPDEWQ